MARIDGFKYEPWEQSSTIARRDFRHSGGGPEELPHRAKSKGKPRKHDRCTENGGKHLYVPVKRITRWTDEREYVTITQECIGCDKLGKRLWHYTGEVYQTVVVEMHKPFNWRDPW